MLDLILISVALFVLEGAFNLFVQKLPAPHFGNLWKIANRWADPGLQAWKPRVSCDRRRSKCAFVCTDAHPFGLSCCLKIWNPQIGFIRSYQIYIIYIMVYHGLSHSEGHFWCIPLHPLCWCIHFYVTKKVTHFFCDVSNVSCSEKPIRRLN